MTFVIDKPDALIINSKLSQFAEENHLLVKHMTLLNTINFYIQQKTLYNSMETANCDKTHYGCKSYIHGIILSLLSSKIVSDRYTCINPYELTHCSHSQMKTNDISHHKPHPKPILIDLVYMNRVNSSPVCMLISHAIFINKTCNEYLTKYNQSYISYKPGI